jgi:predicted amidohydrolase
VAAKVIASVTVSGALRVSLVGLPARWNEQDAQLEWARAAVPTGSADLVLLPEAGLTGYVSPELDFDLSPFAEPLEQGTQRLAELAFALDSAVVGPVIEKHGSAAFNAMVGVDPDGRRWLHYRKRHPWYPETWATPGAHEHPVVEWRGFTMTAAICFDVHFLATEAEDALRRADVLLFPTAWVDGGETRGPLMADLAARFGLVILNANWGPGRPRVPGQDPSLVAWPDGSVTAASQPRFDVTLTTRKAERER